MSSEVFEINNNNSGFRKFDIPVKMGIILSIVICLITVINYMVVLKMPNGYIPFMVINFCNLIAAIVVYMITGKSQRKAMGGYINIKDAFSALFVVVLISTIISSIFGIIYTKYIDPGSIERMKDATLSFMENMKVPQSQIDKAAEDFDKRVGGSTSFKNLTYGIASSLILNSIIAFICAAIVKKDRPAHMN